MTPHRWTLAAFGARVTVEVDSDALAHMAGSFYPDYRTDASGEAELRVTSGDDGFRVLASGDPVPVDRRGLGLSEAIFLFELLTSERLLHRIPMHVLHAGAVRAGGRVALFSGWGGAGKSSLVAALALHGRPVYGDDVALLEPGDGRIHAFRRFLKLVDPVPELLGLGPSTAPTAHLWPESHYQPEALGTVWAEPAPIGWVVFPAYDPGAPPAALEPLSGGDAVRRLMEQVLLSDGPPSAEFDVLTAALAHADFFQLRFSSLEQASESVLEALEEG